MNRTLFNKTLLATAIASMFAGGALAQDLTLAPGIAAVSGPAVDNNQALLQLNAASGTPSAQIFDVFVGTQGLNVNSPAAVTNDNSIDAAATGNTASLAQILGLGEDTVTVSQTAQNTGTPVTAAARQPGLIGAGVLITPDGNITGNVTVDANTISSRALGNDGDLTLSATGANGGQNGNTAAVGFAGGGVQLTGDLNLGVLQENLDGSDIAATTGAVAIQNAPTIGVNLQGAVGVITTASDLDASVTGNAFTADATGNQVVTNTSENLAGSDVDVAVGVRQRQEDSAVTAVVTARPAAGQGFVAIGVRGGGGQTEIADSDISVAGNRAEATATANRADNTVASNLRDAEDSVQLSTRQDLLQVDGDADVQASVLGARIGIRGGSQIQGATNVDATVSGNRVGSEATGNAAAQRLNPAAGNIAGPADSLVDQRIRNDNAGDPLLLSAETGLQSGLASDEELIVIGSQFNFTEGGSLVVDNNTAESLLLGNSASNTLGPISGQVLDATASTRTLQGVSFGENVLGFSADTRNVTAGIFSGTRVDDAPITVSNNAALATTVINSATSNRGDISGAISAGGTVSTLEDQDVAGIGAGAFVQNADFGIDTSAFLDVPDGAVVIAPDNDVALTVSGNTAATQVDANAATQNLGDASGDVAGALTATTDQRVTGSNLIAQTGADATDDPGQGVVFGIDSNDGAIGSGASKLDLVVNGNTASSLARANVAARNGGGLSGGVSGTVLNTTLQEVDNGSQVAATTQQVRAGLTAQNAAIATGSGALVTVNDNQANATARGNQLNNALDGVSGSITGAGSVTNTATQTVEQNALVEANVLDADFGVIGSPVNLQLSGINLTVSGNSVRADAAANTAAQSLGPVSGQIAGAPVSLLVNLDQSVSASEVLGRAEDVNFGAQDNPQTDVGGSGPVQIAVQGNSSTALASGNVGSNSLDGISGTIAAGSGVSSTLSQATTGATNIDATSADIDFGFDQIGDIASGGSPVGIAVSNNEIVTAASGNTGTQILGNVSGQIAGAIVLDTVQSNAAGVDIDAETLDDVDIGAEVNGSFGAGAGGASLAVSNNAVTSQNIGNSQTSLLGAISGGIADTGALTVNSEQTNAYDGTVNRVARTDGVQIGLHFNAGANVLGNADAPASIAVSDNAVTSSLFGNFGQTDVQSISGVLNGSVSFTGSQTNTGDANSQAELESIVSATVPFIGLGVEDPNASVVAANAVVSNNSANANLIGNFADRRINNVSGVLNAPGTLTISDTQSNTDLNATSRATGLRVGAFVGSNTDSPLNLVASNNVVGASVTGNALNQSLAAGGLFNNGVISQTASQTNSGGQLLAQTSNVHIGLNNTGSGVFTGSSIVSGNSITANATGNAASVSRTR